MFQLADLHGLDIYLLRQLVIHSRHSLFFRLLEHEVQLLAHDPLLAGRFRDCVDDSTEDVFRDFDLVRFLDWLDLRPLEKLILAAPMISCGAELFIQAMSVIQLEFDAAMLALRHSPSFEQTDLSPKQVARLMSNLLSDPPPDSPVLDARQRQALIVASWSKYGRQSMAPILHQIFPSLRYVAQQSEGKFHQHYFVQSSVGHIPCKGPL